MKYRKTLFIFYLFLSLIILLSGGFLVLQRILISRHNKSQAEINKNLFSSPTPHSNSQNTYQPLPEKKLVIKRMKPDGEEIIYEKDYRENHYIVRWGKYLFFDLLRKGSDTQLLARHNLETGITEVIHKEELPGRQIGYLSVINNTLFYGVGGYGLKEELYWLDTPLSSPQLIKYDDPTLIGVDKIEVHNGKYLLKGFQADACWSVENWGILDFNKKVSRHITTFYGGCEGEKSLGIDKRNRIISVYKQEEKLPKKTGNIPEGVYDYIPNYIYIFATPIDKPQEKVVLVDRSRMPKSVTGISFSPLNDQILLLGEELSILDLKTLEIKKIADISMGMDFRWAIGWENNKVCIAEGSSESFPPRKVYFVDIDTGKIEKESKICKELIGGYLANEEKKHDIEVQKIIKSLELPYNYKILIEEK